MSAARSKPAIPTEHQSQVALFQWAKLASAARPELGLMFAIPNGARTSISTAKKLKAEGLKKGVPDILLPVPRRQHIGLWVEMKRKGNYPSPEQKAWIAALREQGYRVEVCYGTEEAIATIDGYLRSESPA